MNKFIGLVILGCAFAVGFGSITGCPKPKDKTKGTPDSASVTVDKDKAKGDPKGDADKKDPGKTVDADKKDPGKAVDVDKTKKEKEEPKNKLTVTKPAALTIKQGATEDVKISITRVGFTDAVNVKIDKLPPGIGVVDKEIKIAANGSDVTFKLKAEDTAPEVKSHMATVTVTGGELTNSGDLPITIQKK